MDLNREKLVYHFKALWHTARLGDSRADPVVSMRALRDLGKFSIPHLRRTLSDTNHVEAQIRSAVVLHWLDQRDGLPFLIDTLLYRNTGKDLRKELNFAFGQVGVPDSSHAIADAFCRIGGLSDTLPSAVRAIELLKELKDTSVVPIIAAGADRAPELFCSLCGEFGQNALEPLRHMAESDDASNRLAAVLGLEQIGWPKPIDIVTGLLRDNDERVRNAAADSVMSSTGPVSALLRLRSALAEGFISPNAIRAISLLKPVDLQPILVDLLARYAEGEAISDASAAEALAALSEMESHTDRVISTVCQLAILGKSGEFCEQAARLLGAAGGTASQSFDETDAAANAEARHIEITAVLFKLLSSEDGRVRSAAADALFAWNESFGKAFIQLLYISRPPESLIKNLQAVFAGLQDVGSAVSDAVGHVSNWISRFTRETAEKYAPEDSAWREHEWILKDPRLPDVLGALINNAFTVLDSPNVERLKSAAEASACALKAAASLTLNGAAALEPQLKRACLYTFNAGIRARMAADTGRNDALLFSVRLTAAQALISLKHPDTFALLCDGLNSLTDGVVETSAVSLSVLGETRAISALQNASRRKLSAQAAAAVSDAISRIRKSNPDTTTLLRGASADGAHEGLLRPAADRGLIAADTLVRPAGNPDSETSEQHYTI